MKKNAFSLVELLAVIVLLGVIMLIAVAAVTNLTTGTKISTIVKNEKMIAKAAENYLASGAISAPIDVGSSIEITVSELQTKGFLDPIKSPNNQSTFCNGYVIVTKLEDDELSFTPHLDCLNGIGTATADGLVAHYTFDDYQQPATNLLTNPLNFAWIGWANTSDGWSISSQTLNSDYDNDGQMKKFIITPGTTATSSNAQFYSSNNSIVAGKTYGLSFYIKALVGRKINVSMIQNGTPYASYVTASKDFNVTTEWQRFEGTFTAKTTASDARIQISTGFDLQSDELYIYKPQLEEGFPTQFVNGTRTAIVKDYSINSNSGNMILGSSPKWISNSVIGTGAYEFDGINDYIDFGAVSENILRQGKESSNFTLSAWIKTTGNQDAGGRIIIARPGYHDGIQMSTDNKVTFGIYDENSNNRSITSPTLSFNVNHYVVGVYYNKTMYLYIDGVLVGTNNFFSANPTVKFRAITSSFMSGAATGGSVHQFRGIIDDVRIYTRALSANEILQNYNIELYKINNK